MVIDNDPEVVKKIYSHSRLSQKHSISEALLRKNKKTWSVKMICPVKIEFEISHSKIIHYPFWATLVFATEGISKLLFIV